jgi:hypothetical protein
VTRVQIIVAPGETFHLPGKHNQKSHGNRAGKKDNVPGKTSKYAPIIERLEEQSATAPRMTDDELDTLRKQHNKDSKMAKKGNNVFSALKIQGGMLHTLTEYQKNKAADDPSRTLVARSVEDYRGAAYKRINEELRAGDVSEYTQSHVENIDRLMMLNELESDVIVHRGVSPQTVFGPGWNEDADNSGLEWIDNGYVSSSADPRVANRFTSRSSAQGVIMTMLVRKGVQAIPTADIKPTSGEKELLINHGMRYRLISDSGASGQSRSIVVEVSRPE